MMDLTQPLTILIPAVRSHVEQLLRDGIKIAQYRFGFYRVPFTTSRLEEGISLNVWLNELPAEHLPHEHIYHLRSRILKGSLTKHLWEVNADPNGPYQTIRAICDETTSRDVKLPQRVSLACSESKTFTAGGMYEIPFGQIHTTTINSFPTVTLVEKTGVREDVQPIHYAPLKGEEAVLKEFNFFEDHDNEKAKQLVREVLEALDQAARV